MTVVLGTRTATKTPDRLAERRAEWVRHFQQPAHQTPDLSCLPPVPVQEIRLHADRRGRPLGSDEQAREHGAVGLYARRIEAQKAQRMTTGRPLKTTRTSARRDTVALGRGTTDHYQSLYPTPDSPAFPEMRLTAMAPRPAMRAARESVSDLRVAERLRAIRHTAHVALHAPRLVAPRKAIMASLASLVLMASAFTATQAQERYVVQEGDTLQSIAAEFHVDPDAIYASSFMPNGMTVEPGQVIIIPDPGQTPSEASAMASEREGTSPWVKGAHTVVAGDTLESIAGLWGVGIEDLEAANPGVSTESLQPGQRILIPDGDNVSKVSPEKAANVTKTGAMVPIANYVQQRNLSCEFAATYSATTAYGNGVSEQTFIDTVPLASNPHHGYRGNIDGVWGNTTDYGVYPEPLVPVLNQHGFGADVMYTSGDVGPLKQQLDSGRPVVVWLGFWGDNRQVLNDDGTYSVFAGMHVLTAFGYDEGGVYLMDPFRGEQVYYTWAYFTQLWGAVDGMSMAVYPL